MYGKIVDGRLVEAPYHIQKGNTHYFGYNDEDNAEMLLADGYKPVERTPVPEDLRQPVSAYYYHLGKIIEIWSEGYTAPELTYAQHRAEEYPDPREFLDAQVKIASGNLMLEAEGQLQLKAYVEECLAVKARYPKEDSADVTNS